MTKHGSRTVLFVIPLMVAFGSAGWAQPMPPASTQDQPQAQTKAAAPQGPQSLRKLFAWADKNSDGRVTREEAKGHLPITYLNFEQADTEKRGSISFDQFMAFTNKRVAKQADEILTQWDKY